MTDQENEAAATEGEKQEEESPPETKQDETETKKDETETKKDETETKKDETETKKDEAAEGEEEAAPEEEKKESKNFLGIPGIPAAKKISMPTLGLDKEPEVEPPNALWKHIANQDWEEAAKDLNDDESALVMAKEWHKQDLPIHAICKTGKAPDEVAIKLIDISPEALKKRGKSRMLPLQLAVKHKCSYNIVRKLIRTYPEALDAYLSDDGIRKETTRTWVDLQGTPADVKKLVHRTTADWKVIIEYEDEQHEQHDKLISLEKKLKTAKKKQDATDQANKTLLERVEHLESAHSNMQDFVNEIVGRKKEEFDENLEEIRGMLIAFTESQSAKNKELQDEIDESKRREIEGRAVFNGFTEDLLTLHQQNTKVTEEIKQSISEEKSTPAD